MALLVASLVIFGVGTGFVFVTRAWADHQARTQVQQSLRSTIAALNRDVRVAGACMPVNSLNQSLAPNFVPLAGTNGTNDTITVSANPGCGNANVVTNNCNACTSITVADSTGFTAGQWAFISNAGAGEFFLTSTVVAGAPGTINVDTIKGPSLVGGYPKNTSQVTGADQRKFAVSTTCAGCNTSPTLTVQLLGGSQLPLVKGIDGFKVQYVLNRLWNDPSFPNGAACNAQTGGTPNLCVVNLPGLAPSLASDWNLVRAIIATVDARSTITVRASGSSDGFLHEPATFEISPRNLTFPQNPGRL
ncbi:MAG TPA: hypothetical protein VJT32_16955 [bacterium]|nr:hypothetical protein [bacterium]